MIFKLYKEDPGFKDIVNRLLHRMSSSGFIQMLEDGLLIDTDVPREYINNLCIKGNRDTRRITMQIPPRSFSVPVDEFVNKCLDKGYYVLNDSKTKRHLRIEVSLDYTTKFSYLISVS